MNLFAYTGAFTVYAAAGGRADDFGRLVENYLRWAGENLRLNGFTAESIGWFVKMLASFSLARSDENLILAVVDPPTFSNSKRLETRLGRAA